jgi:Raf kinase inhibitor-like YbhB/YbcL family protein
MPRAKRMKTTTAALVTLVACAFLGACHHGGGDEEGALSITLTSPAFADRGHLAPKYTCDGPGVSPPLAWSGVPQGTRTLALIVDDPDAPGGTWVHWVLYDLPPSTRSVPEGASAAPLPPGAHSGVNGWKRPGYGAACPPSGIHRYVHTLYALDRAYPGQKPASADELRRTMHGHVLARGKLVAVYGR